MESWGNNRAAQYFEAELPPNFVRPREGDSVRTTEKFIRDKYEHRKYCGREIPPPTEYETQAADEPANRRRSKATSSSSNRVANRPSNVTPTAAPVKAPVKEEPNLLDFMEDTPAFPDSSQGTQPQMMPQQQQQQFSPGFDQFQSAPNVSHVQAQQLPQDNGLLQPVAPAPPKASANDILSMFNQPPPNMYGQAPMGGMMGGQVPMGGMMGGQVPMGGMMGGQAPMGGMMNMGMPGAHGQQMMPPMNNMGHVQGFPPQQMQQPPQNMNMQGGPMQQQMGMGTPGQQRPPQMNNPYGQQMMQQGMPLQMGGMPMQMGMGGPPGHPQQQMFQNHMPPQQQMQQMGGMMGMNSQQQMMYPPQHPSMQGDFPSQAPPPLPSHPPSQDQGVFNFGSPNNLMSHGAR